MKTFAKIFLASVTLIFAFASFIEDKVFVGKIRYRYSFTNLAGDDITDRLSPFFGKEQIFFIDTNNYKAYNENNQWVQLYNGNANLYYYFSKDSTAVKIYASTQSAQKITVTKLTKTEKIAGYNCNTVLIETENTSTIYYYNSSVRTLSQKFAMHNLSEWNKYLEATNGALPLKYIMTDLKKKYIWTSTAFEVTEMSLRNEDFKFPSNFKLKN